MEGRLSRYCRHVEETAAPSTAIEKDPMKRFLPLLLSVVALAAVAPEAQALPGRFRAYGGTFDGRDFMLGAGYELGIPFVTFVPNAEYVFTGDGSRYENYTSLNIDAQLSLLPIPFVDFWFGGGIGTAFFKSGGGESTTGGVVNLFAGVGVDVIPLDPYLQFKYVFKPDSEVYALTFGIRF